MKSNIEIYLFPLGAISIVVLLGLVYLLWRAKKQMESKNKEIKEKDEKIKWLRQIAGENEYSSTSKAHETQKQIMALEHTVKILESQAKEGTKNQVVSKIEALQSKRVRELERTGLEL
ncbi:MAG: hypothetical protein Q9M39_04455 [Sulfurovum sp.]|nr:hypothetical protein [Sulfurovum sp.]